MILKAHLNLNPLLFARKLVHFYAKCASLRPDVPNEYVPEAAHPFFFVPLVPLRGTSTLKNARRVYLMAQRMFYLLELSFFT